MTNEQNDRITPGSVPPDAAVGHQQALSRSLNMHPKQTSPRKAPIPTEASLDSQVLNQYGVTRTNQDGVVQYRMAGSADNSLLFEAKAGANEFAQSSHKLQELTAAKETALQSQYHVAFSTENDNAFRPLTISPTNPNKYVPGAMVHARAPRLSELMGIEAALKASQPSQYIDHKGDKGLKFYFLKTPSFGKQTFDAGMYASDSKDRLSVFFEPDAQPDRPITAADATKEHQDIKTSIEALAAHEIAHNSEYQMGLWDPEKLKPLAEQIGWTVTPNSSAWLLKGKGGEFYRLTNDGLSNDHGWVRCNSNGVPLDKEGKPFPDSVAFDKDGNLSADVAAAPHFSNEEVREKALVRPPTDYFTAPDEMLADSLMLYRSGEAGREQLSKSGSQLFNLVKDFDQAEIDARFGKAADGSPAKVRLPNGDLANNNEYSPQIVSFPDQRQF